MMKKVKIADLKFYEKNAKAHPEEQVEKIKKSIEKFGYRGGIKVMEDLTIIIGHGRILALQKMGRDEVEVEVIDDLKPEDIIAYRLADNRTAESKWLDTLLAEEIKALEELDYDLSLTGFDEYEISAIIDSLIDPDDKDDEVPDLPEQPKSKLGEVYQLGNHRLMCGDATKQEDVEKLMDGQKADMVFTDPPYGVNFTYNSYDDNISKDDHAKFCKKWINILKEYSDFIVLTPGFDNEYIFFDIDKSFSSVVWFKKFSISASRVAFARTCEPIFILGKPPIKRYNTDFFEYGTDRIKGLKKDHPCPKPIDLIIALIKPQTNRGQSVLDVFGGSGSTLIACEKLNRKGYMMELDPKYVDVIIERWESFTGKKAKKL